MRILIAEDDFVSRILLATVLKKSGYEVIETVNGAEAMDVFMQPDPPLLAVLDWMMPEMDGPEVVRRVRTLQIDPPPYIIMLTALSGKSDIIAGLEIGANDYLSKPFDAGELLARIEVGRRMTEMHAELLKAQRKNNEAFDAAGKIQHSLLPKNLCSAWNQVDFAWKFKPCDAIGGDLFNFFPLDDSHIGLFMLDVAGHGLPSAMISFLVYQLLNPHTGILVDYTATPPVILEPEAVLNILDREFPLKRFERHFTVVYAVLDINRGTLTYSNAAHCAPIIIPRENDLKSLTVSGTVIGLNAFPFGQETVALSPGDKILFFSDGVIEIWNASEEIFGEDRLHQTLREMRQASPDELVQGIYTQITDFAEALPVADDISMLALEIKAFDNADS